jgi:hypothetical protein
VGIGVHAMVITGLAAAMVVLASPAFPHVTSYRQ